MSALAGSVEVPSEVAPATIQGRSPRQLFWMRFRQDKAALFGLCVVTILILLAVFAGVIAHLIGHGPNEVFQAEMSDDYGIPKGPNSSFWFGADAASRDLFVRVLYGARTSLLISVVTVVLSGTIGTAIGVVSGFFGGKWVDSLFQRVMDTVLAVPGLVLLLFIAAVLGPSIRHTIIALTFLIVPSFNRVARGEMLRIREEPYVEAARANGCSVARILFRHGLPNLFAPLVVVTTLLFAGVLIAESALSFLGIGTPPPTASWGRMLSEGTRFLEISPWMVVFPGGALTLAVLAFNLLGDGLRDFLDPRTRR